MSKDHPLLFSSIFVLIVSLPSVYGTCRSHKKSLCFFHNTHFGFSTTTSWSVTEPEAEQKQKDSLTMKRKRRRNVFGSRYLITFNSEN